MVMGSGFLSGNTGDLGDLWYNLTQNQELPDFLKWYLSMLANTFDMSLTGPKPQVQSQTQTETEFNPYRELYSTSDNNGDNNDSISKRGFPYLNQPSFYGNIGYNPPSVNWGDELKWLGHRGLFKEWTSEPYVQKILNDFPQYLERQFGINITPMDLINMANRYGGGLLGLHKAMPELANRLMYSNQDLWNTKQGLINRGYGGLIHSLTGTIPEYKTEADVISHLNEVDRLIGKVKESLKKNKSKVGSLLGGSSGGDHRSGRSSRSSSTFSGGTSPSARHWGGRSYSDGDHRSGRSSRSSSRSSGMDYSDWNELGL